MERDIIEQLVQWKNNPDRQPLVLQGARQTGKTWIIKHFGKTCFEHIAYFNFEETAELKTEFEATKDVKRLLAQLSVYTEVPLEAKKTLIFFDEIQECNAALNSLKYFCENAPEYAVVAAGSLLGVSLSTGGSFPVGKVDFLQLYPLSFKEFLQAYDNHIYEQINSINTLAELPAILFNKLAEIYKLFLISGGMPQVVMQIIENKGMEKVEQIQQAILNSYLLDFSKHSEKKDVPRITDIWKSIPSQLSKENRKFIYSVVKQGARAREYEDALRWLQQAGLVYLIYANKKPNFPLSAYDDLSAFKIYLSDVGLLRCLAKIPIDLLMTNNALFSEFKGALTENFVLQSLISQFDVIPRYWTSIGKAEVDFIIQYKTTIIPIEVKSERNISSKSLAVYNDLYHPTFRVRYSLQNLKYDGNLLNIPLFLADWSKKIYEMI